MIGIVFVLGSETIEVRIQNSNVYFRTAQLQQFVDIGGLKLNKEGSIKEFPDLKDNKEWKEEVIKRFKEKIKNMKTETEQVKYVIEELSKQGYRWMYYQKNGFRPIKNKNGI